MAEQRGKIKLSMRGENDSSNGPGRAISDSEVIEGKRREELDDTAASDKKSASLLELFAGAFNKKTPAPDVVPPPPVVAPPVPPAAEPTWDIVVQHGSRYELVKFKNSGSRERVDEFGGANRSPAASCETGAGPVVGQPNVVVVPLRPQTGPPTETPPVTPSERATDPEPEPMPAYAPQHHDEFREPKELQA
jgi:hypothetical protein